MSTTEWNNIINTSTDDDSGAWVEVSTSGKKNAKKDKDTRNRNSSTTNNPNLNNVPGSSNLQTISVSDSARTNKFKYSSDHPTTQIRDWANSKLEVSVMMAEFNARKSIWERPRFLQENTNKMLEELSRCRRWDVLIKLMEDKNMFSDRINYLHKGESPFHKLIWPHHRQGENFDKTYCRELIRTFRILISMGFDVFMNNLDRDNEYETFIGALIKPKNPINAEYKSKLYNYFTEECKHYEFNDTVVTNLLNKCNNKITANNNNLETKFNHINDKILFIIQKFGIDYENNKQEKSNTESNTESNSDSNTDSNTEFDLEKDLDLKKESDIPVQTISSIQSIFNFCCNMSVEPIKRTNTWVQNVCLAILSNPNPGQDFYTYLAKRDINKIKIKFIKSIISNYESWIDKWVNDCMNYKEEQGEMDDEEFEKEIKHKIIYTYANLMIMFATFYSKSYKKQQILNTVQDIIENILVKYEISNEEKVNVTTYFLQNSSIQISQLTNEEKQLFKYLINNFYKNEKKFLKAKTQISICIGNLSNETSQSNINNIITELGNN